MWGRGTAPGGPPAPGGWGSWPMQQSSYTGMPHEQVDWASVAKQWIANKETSDGGIQQPNDQDTTIPLPPPPGQVFMAPPSSQRQAAIMGAAGWHWDTTNWAMPNWAMPPPPPPPPGEQNTKPEEMKQFNYDHGYQGGLGLEGAQEMVSHGFDYHHGAWPDAEAPDTEDALYPPGQTPPDCHHYHTKAEDQYEVNQYSDSGMVPGLDLAKRRALPAWIREGLEKMEQAKLKHHEQEQLEKEAEPQASNDTELKNNDPLHTKSRFDSDEEDTGLVVEAQTQDQSPRASSPEPELTEEEKQAHLMLRVRKMLTEVLIGVTNSEILSIATEVYNRERSKAYRAPARQLAKSTALASITSLGLGYWSDSEEEEDEDAEGRDEQARVDSSADYSSADEAELLARSKHKRQEFERRMQDLEQQGLDEEDNKCTVSKHSSKDDIYEEDGLYEGIPVTKSDYKSTSSDPHSSSWKPHSDSHDRPDKPSDKHIRVVKLKKHGNGSDIADSDSSSSDSDSSDTLSSSSSYSSTSSGNKSRRQNNKIGRDRNTTDKTHREKTILTHRHKNSYDDSRLSPPPTVASYDSKDRKIEYKKDKSRSDRHHDRHRTHSRSLSRSRHRNRDRSPRRRSKRSRSRDYRRHSRSSERDDSKSPSRSYDRIRRKHSKRDRGRSANSDRRRSRSTERRQRSRSSDRRKRSHSSDNRKRSHSTDHRKRSDSTEHRSSRDTHRTKSSSSYKKKEKDKHSDRETTDKHKSKSDSSSKSKFRSKTKKRRMTDSDEDYQESRQTKEKKIELEDGGAKDQVTKSKKYKKKVGESSEVESSKERSGKKSGRKHKSRSSSRSTSPR